MKKGIILIISLMVILGAYGQEKANTLPSVDLKTPYGKTFNTKSIDNDGDPIIISFWALWCKPCIKELNTIAEVYDEWIDETGVKIYAVSIDDSRSSAKVLPKANGFGWEYEILLDQNQDFKRAMNVNLIPHTFLLDGNKNIVWQHTSFSEGGELELIEEVRKLKAGLPLDDK